jgi:hypothetical protein
VAVGAEVLGLIFLEEPEFEEELKYVQEDLEGGEELDFLSVVVVLPV